MRMNPIYLLVLVCAVALLAACTPTEEVPSCAATLCEVGSTCIEGRGCVKEDNPVPPTEEEDLIGCTDPRPEICTMEYNPVCASVDNGIRCIQAPCPSTDWKTYATGCTACADKNVYGYKPGACNPEVDNNPADDEPEDTTPPRLAFTTCADPRSEMCTKEYNPVCGEDKDGDRSTKGNACTACADASVVGYWPGSCEQPPSDTPTMLDSDRILVCKTDRDETFAAQNGYACVDKCPTGTDQYGSQVGLACVPHAGKSEISLWATCEDASTCNGQRCVVADHVTSGGTISWSNTAESQRCAPDAYATFLLHTSGLTAIDENGDRSTAIA